MLCRGGNYIGLLQQNKQKGTLKICIYYGLEKIVIIIILQA